MLKKGLPRIAGYAAMIIANLLLILFISFQLVGYSAFFPIVALISIALLVLFMSISQFLHLGFFQKFAMFVAVSMLFFSSITQSIDLIPSIKVNSLLSTGFWIFSVLWTLILTGMISLFAFMKGYRSIGFSLLLIFAIALYTYVNPGPTSLISAKLLLSVICINLYVLAAHFWFSKKYKKTILHYENPQ